MTATLAPRFEAAKAPAVPFAQLARDRYGELRPSEQRVVDVLFEMDPSAVGTTAAAVALALRVSQATVINTVQRLGYGGYGAFKRALIAERALESVRPAAVAADALSEDPLLGIAARIFVEDRTILDATAALVGEAFRQAAGMLAPSVQVLCFGSGLSGVVARLAAGTFRKYGIRAAAEDHATEQLAQVDVAEAETALLVISYRGQNLQLVEVAARARERGMPVVVLTNSPASPLARAADVVLLTAGPVLSEEMHPNQTGVRGAQLALARALAEAVAWKRTQAQQHS